MSAPELLATCWTTAGTASPLGVVESPLALPDRIAAAAAAGFTGFGVVNADLERYLRDHSLAELRSILDDHGMTSVELELLSDWWVPEGPPRDASDHVRDLLLEASEALDPHHVKIGPSISDTSYDLETYAEAFHRTSDAFASVGTTIALEFLPFSNIATLADSVTLVRTAGHPAGGLLIDLWHVMRGPDGQLEALTDVPLEMIKGIELDDADAEQVGDAYTDTVMRRRLPGEGDWPVPRFIQIMQEKGWSGPWGVEILSETHRNRPLSESLPDVVATTLAQFEIANAAISSR
jgi:sugar phosphate isomerase/epimerase